MAERIPEHEYNEMTREFIALCRELKSPAALGSWSFHVKDRQGIITDSLECSSQSWLRNYYNAITCMFCSVKMEDLANWGDGFLNYRNPDGTILGIAAAGALGIGAQATNIVDGGIIVGSGTTAETFNDYALDALIAQGRAAGELYYFGNQITDSWNNVQWVSGNRTFSRDVNRWIMNLSGGTILVKEAGLIETTGTSPKPLFVRDVLPATVTIPHLSGVIAKHTITSMVFPS